MGQTWANRQKAEGSSKLQLALHMFAINKAASSEVETGACGSVKQASRVEGPIKLAVLCTRLRVVSFSEWRTL